MPTADASPTPPISYRPVSGHIGAEITGVDLREPLRGINNYAAFVLEDCADSIDSDGIGMLRRIGDLEIGGVSVYLGDVLVASAGGRHAGYREADAQRVMEQAEITVRAVLGRGAARATIWTCDLSHQYVTINAEYRT